MGPEAVFFMLLTLTPILAGMVIRNRIRYREMERRFWAVVEHFGLPPSVIRGDLPPQLLDRARIAPLPADSRLEQLESRFDQLAEQIDRLTESQDFLARVMVDRGSALPDPTLRTPH